MTLLTPLALALLAFIPPIIALYFLKLRRQEQVVSSTYLWQRFVRDVEANAPWQKLRLNLLLLLQILFMLALILALARPASETGVITGQNLVLILDTSASMSATDGADASTTRLETAQAIARDLIANLPDEARITVIAAAGGQAEVLASASRDRRQALAAIAAVTPTAQGSDLSPALALAEALVARQPAAEIVLLSDGAGQIPPHLTAPVRFIPIGQSGDNQAIRALTVELSPAGQPRLFVQVSNYADRPVQRRLVIQADDLPLTAFDLNLPPGGHAEQTVETLPVEAQTITAYLTPGDALPLDDRAWVILQPTGPIAVTLVTPGNFFLTTALNLLNSPSMGLNLNLTLTSPADWKNGPDAPPALYIFDSFIPATLPPGNLLFINPPRSAPGLFEITGQIAAPVPVPAPAAATDPLLQNLNLAETQIFTAAVIFAPLRALITAQPVSPPPVVPLLLAGEIEGRRLAILPFDLHQSDLPLRPAFPILVANLLNYLALGAGRRLPADLTPGESLTLSTPPEITHLRLTWPDGRETDQATSAGRVNLPPLTQPGLYRLAFEPGAETARLAVNFFNPQESAIAPHPNLTFTDGNAANPVVAPTPARREWWRPLALIALALLVAEWLLFQRGALLKYRSLIRARKIF